MNCQHLQSFALLQCAFQNAYNGMLICSLVDGLTKTLYVNDAFTKITGYTQDEIAGQRVRILQGADTDAETLAQLYEAVLNNRAYHGEVQIAHKLGHSVWVETGFVPVQLADQSRFFIAIVCDITERRHMTKQLADSEKKFRTLIQSTSDIIQLLTVEGEILFQSPSTAQLLGHSPETMEGCNCLNFVHPDDIAAAREALALMAAGKESLTIPALRARTAAGQWRYLEILASNLLKIPHINAVLINARDITERRELQENLMLTERLSAIGTLAAGVAHEINNPLAYILTNLEYVAQVLPKVAGCADAPLAAELNDALADTLRGAKQIKRIVSDLRALSRSNEDDEQAVAVDKAIVQACNIAMGEIRNRASFVTHIEEGLCVKGSEARIMQVVLNLLINAAQAIPPGQVAENRIALSLARSAENAVIAVSDTGVGIPEENVPKLFTPFFTTKPPGQGTGLGLPICHKIVKALHGNITIETHRGVGTTVTVTLPLAPAAGE